MDILRRLLAARNIQIAATRRTGTNKDGVVIFGQQRFQAVDHLAQSHLGAEVGDVADLFVDDFLRQAELGDLAADHATGAGIAVVDHTMVPKRRQVAGNGQRRWASADQCDLLAVAGIGFNGQPVADVAFVIRRNSLQTANGDGLFLDPAAAAGGLTRAVAGTAEDAGKDVGVPVDHEGVGIPTGGDQPDILRDRGVGGTGPLAIDDLMEVVGVLDVRRLQPWILHPDRVI